MMGAYRDQIPFVMSQLMNDSAFKTRQVLVNTTWPEHVNVRNKAFINAALHINKSTKHNLVVEIFDQIGRAHLKLHDTGGTKTAIHGGLAIPFQLHVPIGPQGVNPIDRPKAWIARTPKRALRITSRGFFVGQHGKLRLLYTLKPSAPIKADVPFSETFNYIFSANMRTSFVDTMERAMHTRIVGRHS
jgi:hypothetical protein